MVGTTENQQLDPTELRRAMIQRGVVESVPSQDFVQCGSPIAKSNNVFSGKSMLHVGMGFFIACTPALENARKREQVPVTLKGGNLVPEMLVMFAFDPFPSVTRQQWIAAL